MACRVTASKLADADKSQVALAVRVLGGSYSKRLSKYHTHLIMPTTGGPKFDASASKGAEVVTADWLADSAIAGLNSLLPQVACSTLAHT